MSELALSFRLATAADAPTIAALVEAAYRGDASRQGWTTEADLLEGQRTDPAGVASIVAATDAHVILATDRASGGLVACCEVREPGARRTGAAYFGMFAVDPTLQGGGVGRIVLAEAERRAREDWGAGRMEMTVIRQRTELIDWYERRGYARTGQTEPFPYGDDTFGLPQVDDLEFEVLAKALL